MSTRVKVTVNIVCLSFKPQIWLGNFSFTIVAVVYPIFNFDQTVAGCADVTGPFCIFFYGFDGYFAHNLILKNVSFSVIGLYV